MAFTKRIWLPHDVQYPERKILLSTGNPNEYDFNRSEGIVNAAGDLLSADNLNELETRIFNQFGIVPEISSGVWTPTLYGYTTAGSPTYTSQGMYYKIGGLVILHSFFLAVSNLGGMTGNTRIGGLPFNVSNYGTFIINTCLGYTLNSGYALCEGYMSGSDIVLQSSNNVSKTELDCAQLTNTFNIYRAAGFYIS